MYMQMYLHGQESSGEAIVLLSSTQQNQIRKRYMLCVLDATHCNILDIQLNLQYYFAVLHRYTRIMVDFIQSGGVNTPINMHTLSACTPKCLSTHIQALWGIYRYIKVKTGTNIVLNTYIWWHGGMLQYIPIYIYRNTKSNKYTM